MGTRLRSGPVMRAALSVREGVKDLWLSVSGMEDFRKCPRYYYLKRVKRLALREMRLPLVVGRIANVGVHHILSGDRDWQEAVAAAYKEEKLKIKRDQLVMTADEMEKFQEQEYVVPGMMRAYQRVYKKSLAETKHIQNEKPFVLWLKDVGVRLVGRIDNIIERRKKRLLHEFKTSKKIDGDYVEAIQTDFQTGVYWYANRELVRQGDPQGIHLDGILYDVVRKPSIRKREKESYQEYLMRLAGWYDGGGPEGVFHAEVLKEPKLTKEDVFNTVYHIASDIRRAEVTGKMEDFYQDFTQCHRYGRCEMYKICHEGGLTKRVLVSYREREVARVEDGL